MIDFIKTCYYRILIFFANRKVEKLSKRKEWLIKENNRISESLNNINREN